MRKHTISLDTKIRIQCLEDKHENILNNIFYQPFQKQYELLSKHSWNFDLNYENELQFKFTVPASLFNPYVSICSHAFLELIFENKIPLKNLDVADVGCGCGIIGLSAILKGAKSVTFSDIDQDINIIKKNPLFDSSACSVKIRSLLSKEKSKFDVVFFSFPINASNEKRFNSS